MAGLNLRKITFLLFLLWLPIAVLDFLALAGRIVVFSSAFYILFHSLAEIFSVIIFIMVFAVGWWSSEPNAQAKGFHLLAVGFLVVGLFDLGHLLSSAGIPDFITPNSSQKSIAFWLAARLSESLLLLWAALPEAKRPFLGVARRTWLISGVLGVMFVYFMILGHQDVLPDFYHDGYLTGLKVGIEYLIIGILVLAALNYFKRLRRDLDGRNPANGRTEFLLIIGLAIISELAFIRYNSVTDLSSVTGHIYKVFDVVLIYRWLFVRSIREPYVRLDVLQREVQQGRAKYATMLNAVREGIFLISDEGEILEVNQAVSELSGYTREEILNQKLASLEIPELSQRVNLSKLLSGAGHYVFESLLRQKEGSNIPVGVTINRIPGDAGVFLVRVADLRDRQEASRLRKRAEVILNNAMEGMILLNAVGKIEVANRALLNILGYYPDEVIGISFEQFLAVSPAIILMEDIFSTIKENGKWEGKVELKRKDGSTCPVHVTVTGIYTEKKRLSQYFVVFQDLSRYLNIEEQLFHHATHDQLTGLANRMYFLEQVKLISKQNPANVASTFLMAKVKNLKKINLEHGYLIGDAVICKIVARLRNCLPESAILGRWEGDQFVVFIPGGIVVDIGNILESITVEMHKRFQIRSIIQAELAIGVATGTAEGEGLEELIHFAELAMEEARQIPGTAYRFYQQGLHEKLLERMKMENSIRRALDNKEFTVYYQPLVNVKNGSLIGLEALVRWQDPELGLISPAQFIPAAEESGLIILLGEQVLRQACAQARAWLDRGFRQFHIAVNLSAKQFADHGFVALVRDILQEYRLPEGILVLEITESTAMQDVKLTSHTLSQLKKLGVSFALDDFGVGYSCLSYLKKFPMDWLKIDKSFIDGIVEHSKDVAIVRAMINMAQGLGLEIVAEGVEQLEQVQVLKELGCDIIQGYIISSPVPASVAEIYFNKISSLPQVAVQ